MLKKVQGEISLDIDSGKKRIYPGDEKGLISKCTEKYVMKVGRQNSGNFVIMATKMTILVRV